MLLCYMITILVVENEIFLLFIKANLMFPPSCCLEGVTAYREVCWVVIIYSRARRNEIIIVNDASCITTYYIAVF